MEINNEQSENNDYNQNKNSKINIEKSINSNTTKKHLNLNGIIMFLLLTVTIMLFYSIWQYNQLNKSIVNLSKSYNIIQIENITFKEKIDEQNRMLDEINIQMAKYGKEKITKEQFTEIYMQIKELTGMISEEKKRDYYLSRIVNIITSTNKELSSETVYEIAKNIYEISLKYKFNPFLICALIKVESDFKADSISDSYAYGLCQVRRFIAKELAENLGIEWDGAEKTLLNPEKNIQIGIHYLAMLNDDFGDIKLALTAYNYGPFKVQEIISQNNDIPNGYSDKILKYYARYRGFKIEEVEEILNEDSDETNISQD